MSVLDKLAFYRLKQEDLWAWLVEHGVLPTSMDCPWCHAPCKLRPELEVFQCWRTWCIKIVAWSMCSAQNGTWFANSWLTVRKISLLRHVDLHVLSENCKTSNFGLSMRTVVDWFYFCHEVFFEWAIKKFSTVRTKSRWNSWGNIWGKKYNKGLRIIGNWVFGGIWLGLKKLPWSCWRSDLGNLVLNQKDYSWDDDH